jgi:hypothetical protein
VVSAGDPHWVPLTLMCWQRRIFFGYEGIRCKAPYSFRHSFFVVRRTSLASGLWPLAFSSWLWLATSALRFLRYIPPPHGSSGIIGLRGIGPQNLDCIGVMGKILKTKVVVDPLAIRLPAGSTSFIFGRSPLAVGWWFVFVFEWKAPRSAKNARKDGAPSFGLISLYLMDMYCVLFAAL